MAFRKRNQVVLSCDSLEEDVKIAHDTPSLFPERGLRTSTGTPSLDQILSSQSGLPLGSSLLVEETGTTDHSGTLSRYFAAEGLVQGHEIHSHGLGDFLNHLPGLVDKAKSKRPPHDTGTREKMKIAWRYEIPGRASCLASDVNETSKPFCHSFDLSKRLDKSAMRGLIRTSCPGDLADNGAQFSLKDFLITVESRLSSSPKQSIHRILIPNFLSPTVYGSASFEPSKVLSFLHGLRGLLRRYSTRATALVSLPISMFSEVSGVIKWMELLFDGVIKIDALPGDRQSHPSGDKTQGILQVRKLPVFHETGGGHESSCMEQRLVIKTTTCGLNIEEFSLPPITAGEDSEDVPRANNGLSF
ncbi:hypothetical protein CDD80_3266 [Ophiocordyceps camponoti-rufipedis]|uniref:Elongator complex protein 4 n=1 Tax=Ophiocordyceps camponoti-rufipedis TaxID=2004952 RepID=A0A2C5ZL27_9HYPO|nr:hypothetical protein CDD80_3266 [Ophiocordyceps camponoti-rufipedis]